MFNVVFQALPILLVDCEKLGGILLPNPVAYEIGDKEFAQVTKQVNASRRQFSESRPRQPL